MITKPEGPVTYEWAMAQAEEMASALRAILNDPEGQVACKLASTQLYNPARVPPPSTLDYAMGAIHGDLCDLLLLAMESGEFSPGERVGFVRYLLRFWTRDDLESAIMKERMRRAFDWREPGSGGSADGLGAGLGGSRGAVAAWQAKQPWQGWVTSGMA